MNKATLILALLVAAPLAALGACGKSSSTGLFADRSIPLIAPAASADTAPTFVGRWAASTAQCDQPMVIEARSLAGPDADCEFDKVDQSSAGFAVSSTCKVAGKLQPVRINMIMPESDHMSSLTLSGGPFKDTLALQRCATR
jgi:hypothetical protein